MRILLTGATGFVGSHLLEGLLKDEHSVCVAKRSWSDIRRISSFIDCCSVYNLDETAISQIFDEQQIDCVIHCATYYGRNDRDCMKNVEANLLFPLELLSIGREKGMKYFINTDSFFGKQIEAECDLDKDLYMYGYTLSKTQFRQWGHMFAVKYGVSFINMKLEHVYGKGDDESKFIPYILKKMRKNVPLIDLSAGMQKRDFVHISDVVNAYRTVIAHLADGNVKVYGEYGVGTGRMWSLREFVEIIHDAVESTSTLNWGAIPMKKGEIMQSRADNLTLRELGWKPQIVEKTEIEHMFRGGGIFYSLYPSPLREAV